MHVEGLELVAIDRELRTWMRMAVHLGKRSVSEGDQVNPNVGAVAVKDGVVVGSGYRGRTGPGHHAEYGVLGELSDLG